MSKDEALEIARRRYVEQVEQYDARVGAIPEAGGWRIYCAELVGGVWIRGTGVLIGTPTGAAS